MTDKKMETKVEQPKPKQKQLGKTKAQVRLRAKKIAAGLLMGKTAGQAIRDAGYAESVANKPGEILANPLIKRTYEEILDAAGATDEAVAKVVADAMRARRKEQWGRKIEDVDDHPVRLKAVEQVHRVRGRFQDRVKVDIDISLIHKPDDELLDTIRELTAVIGRLPEKT